MDVPLSTNPSPLPTGCKFHPTDQELVKNFLKPKIMGRDSQADRFIATVNLYECHPSELPGKSKAQDKKKWYFYNQRQKLYVKGKTFRRRTKGGSWKSTSEPKNIYDEETKEPIAKKRTLRYYTTDGRITDWKISEIALSEQGDDSYVICCLEKHEPKKNRAKNKADSPESLQSESYNDNDDNAQKLQSPPDTISLENHGSLSQSPDMLLLDENGSDSNAVTSAANQVMVDDLVSPQMSPNQYDDSDGPSPTEMAIMAFSHRHENLSGTLYDTCSLTGEVGGWVNFSTYQHSGYFPNCS